MDKDHAFMSRKEFIKKTSTAVVGLGLAGQGFAQVKQEKGKTVTKNIKPLGRTGLRINPIGFGATRTMEPMLLQAALDVHVPLARPAARLDPGGDAFRPGTVGAQAYLGALCRY